MSNILPTENFEFDSQKKEWKDEEIDENESKDVSRFIRLLIYIFDTCFLVFVISYIFKKYDQDWKIILSIHFLYYLIFEWVFGKTIGKFLTFSKVVKKTGKAPLSIWDVFLRTLCRYIPFEPLSYLGSPIGWHDIYSDTRVIHEGNRKSPHYED